MKVQRKMAIYHLKHSHLKPRALSQSKNNKTFILKNILFLLNSFKQFNLIEKQPFFPLSYSFFQERVLILISFQSKPLIWQNLHFQNEFYWKTSSRMPIPKSLVRLPLCSFIQIFSKGKCSKITTWDKRCIMRYWILEKKPIQVDSKALRQKLLE